MRHGTCNFKSFASAVEYYKSYGLSPLDVLDKLDSGEIRLGEPEVPPGARAYLEEGRYNVEECAND